MYDEALNGSDIESLKHYTADSSSSGHLYLARLIGKDEAFRNNVIRKMAERNIATNVHYKPLPMHTAYQKLGFRMENYPNAYEMYKNEITLPLHTLLSDDDVKYVAENLKMILKG